MKNTYRRCHFSYIFCIFADTEMRFGRHKHSHPFDKMFHQKIDQKNKNKINRVLRVEKNEASSILFLECWAEPEILDLARAIYWIN